MRVKSFCNGGGPLKSGRPNRPFSDILVTLVYESSSIYDDGRRKEEDQAALSAVQLVSKRNLLDA